MQRPMTFSENMDIFEIAQIKWLYMLNVMEYTYEYGF